MALRFSEYKLTTTETAQGVEDVEKLLFQYVTLGYVKDTTVYDALRTLKGVTGVKVTLDGDYTGSFDFDDKDDMEE